MTVDNIIFNKYKVLGKKGEGTFSEVLQCQDVEDGTYWACKKMKHRYETLDQVNRMQEVQALRRLGIHPNILQLKEVLFDKQSGQVVLVCELMDMNMYELIKGRRNFLPEQTVRMYMNQLLLSLDFMHSNGIFHRDVKPENILVRENLLKLADFGSCRGVNTQQPYTEYISTRWYRSPECLLTDGFYSLKMDIWSFGCVFYEMMSLRPLFPGANEVDQIAKIHAIMGPPDAAILSRLKYKSKGVNFNFPQIVGTGIKALLPHASEGCIDVINKACIYDAEQRWTARDLLEHPYFREFREAEWRNMEQRQVMEAAPNDRKAQVKRRTGNSVNANPNEQRNGQENVELPKLASVSDGIGNENGVVDDRDPNDLKQVDMFKKLERRLRNHANIEQREQRGLAKKVGNGWVGDQRSTNKPTFSLNGTRMHQMPQQLHVWEVDPQHKSHDRAMQGMFKKPHKSSIKQQQVQDSSLPMYTHGVSLMPHAKSSTQQPVERKQLTNARALIATNNWISYRNQLPQNNLPQLSKSLLAVDKKEYSEPAKLATTLLPPIHPQ